MRKKEPEKNIESARETATPRIRRESKGPTIYTKQIHRTGRHKESVRAETCINQTKDLRCVGRR